MCEQIKDLKNRISCPDDNCPGYIFWNHFQQINTCVLCGARHKEANNETTKKPRT